jgi:Fur family zinc uptake transcriptional regulator
MKHDPSHSGAPAFERPGHDHSACADRLLARAERLCEARGAKLTDIRRRVLEALAADHAPAGAYDVIDRLAREGDKPPAPITVYRALDFLLAQGLAHRIESRNAFVACSHDHAAADGAPVVFLICENCGAVGEAATMDFAKALEALAQTSGFRPRAPVIEISGECAHCRAARAA